MAKNEGIKIPWRGWQVVREIGEGGYGTVYEIERTQSGRTDRAALKVIRIPKNRSEYESVSFSMETEEDVHEFFDNKKEEVLNEVTTMQSLKGYANIAIIDDWAVEKNGENGWVIYIRMELLDTIQKKYKKAHIPEEEIIKIGIDICAALEQCAKKDFIHRDIKPSNILVNEQGDYKLADFGIARTLDHTTYVTGVGTPPYMAPEIYYGRSTDKTADLYSLGLVMYELLNNRRPPFVSAEGKINPLDLKSSTARRMSGEKLPEPARGSEELKQIVLKACSYEPEDRYRTAGAMKKALGFLLGETEEIVEQSIQSEPKDGEIVRAGTEEWYEDEGTIGAESLIMSRPLREKQTIPTSAVKSLTGDGRYKEAPHEERATKSSGNDARMKKHPSKKEFVPKILIGVAAAILCLAILGSISKSVPNNSGDDYSGIGEPDSTTYEDSSDIGKTTDVTSENEDDNNSGTAEKELFGQITGVTFDFSSGAGGWGTVVEVSSDGSFRGYYSDTDLGDTGDDYPKGTVRECSFKGKFTDVEKEDKYTYKARLESVSYLMPGGSFIEDGVMHELENPYGIDNGEEFWFYLPGKKGNTLPQGFSDWMYGVASEDEYLPELKIYGLYNENRQEGFAGHKGDIYGTASLINENSDIADRLSRVSYEYSGPDIGSGYTVSIKGDEKIISTDYFTITLPGFDTWDVSYKREYGILVLYSVKSRQYDYDNPRGMLVELRALKKGDNSYKEWGQFYDLGEIEGRQLVANFPTDVQWDTENAEAESEYKAISEILRNSTSWITLK